MIKLIEAALAMHHSHDALRSHLRSALMTAHGVMDTYSSNGPYLQDVFNKDVVYQHGGKMYRRGYDMDKSVTPPKITLGDPKTVHAAYVSAKESSVAFLADEDNGKLTEAAIALLAATPSVVTTLDLEETDLIESIEMLDEIDLVEVAKSGGTIPVKIIAPGWGSSGYYASEMLKRDGPNVFKAGQHMHWDHATKEEAKAKPERSMATLAAVLSEDAKWDDNGPKGPGLYSKFKPFSDYAPKIAEKAKYTGVSINARGKMKMGEAEGRKGPIIESLVYSQSTDFVTQPGAGGAVLLENSNAAKESQNKETRMSMTEKEQADLREAQTKAARTDALQTDLNKVTLERNQAIATSAYAVAFAEAGLKVKPELLKRLATNAPLKEGVVDLEAIKADVKTFGESFSAPAPKKKGIRDLGGKVAEAEGDEDAENLKDLGESLMEMGMTSDGVKSVLGVRS